MDQAFIDSCVALANQLQPILPDVAAKIAKLLSYLDAQQKRIAASADREKALKAENDGYAKYKSRIAELRKADLEAAKAKLQAELDKLNEADKKSE